jgi:hypothetical protein
MWIEAKIASKLSGTDQLAKYAAALERESEAHRLLVLIAPERRRNELQKHLPRGSDVPAVFRSWSDVHRVLDDWQRESNRRERGRWLATEVMAYMTEQGYGSIRKLSAKQREIVDGAEKLRMRCGTCSSKRVSASSVTGGLRMRRKAESGGRVGGSSISGPPPSAEGYATTTRASSWASKSRFSSVRVSICVHSRGPRRPPSRIMRHATVGVVTWTPRDRGFGGTCRLMSSYRRLT